MIYVLWYLLFTCICIIEYINRNPYNPPKFTHTFTFQMTRGQTRKYTYGKLVELSEQDDKYYVQSATFRNPTSNSRNIKL